MSSDSLTQSNDGRSYEQYVNENSQLRPSSQASGVHEQGTLQEDDTGFVDFKRSHYDIPDTLPEDAEVNFTDDISRRSQSKSQAIRPNSHHAVAPETPAVGQRLFQHAGNGDSLMGLSQLFGQTQWTSAVKKASPTSSRPSPDVFHQNTISPNPLASSPLKNRGLRTSPTQAFTSSPAFPGISSGPSDTKTPSAPTNSHEDESVHQGHVAETPLTRLGTPKRRNVLEPIAEYKSWRKQSVETDTPKSPSQQDSDSESDVSAYRRRAARLKKENASKSFPSIMLPRPNSEMSNNVEVPSTSRPKSAQNRRRTESRRYLAQCHGEPASDKGASQETVADSQEGMAPPQPPRTIPKASDESTEKSTDDAEERPITDLPKPQARVSHMEFRETIPETSPMSISAEPPKLGDIMRQESSMSSGVDMVSFPSLPSGVDSEPQLKGSNEPRPSSLPEQLLSRNKRSSRNQLVSGSSPSIVLASSPQVATRRSVRLGNVTTPSSSGPNSPLPSVPGTGTSTLTSLSATPSVTSNVTPATEPDHIPETTRRNSSSPAAEKAQRRGRLPSSPSGPLSSLPTMKTYSRSRESNRRLTRYSSISTDELAKSPMPVSTKEQKALARNPARKSLTNLNLCRESTMKRGIFEGMVFALSFQGGQTRKSKEKSTDRTTIEQMIRQEGGRILSDGFDELFRFDSFQVTKSTASSHTLSNSLTLLNQDTGFTALVADGHSRKVKYMQALALGIPCLAPRWITSCIAKKEVVDWSSYLLCAGPSALLGEAIRSRSLQPYDASTAKLADVINNRPKLLDEAQILLVMKKTKNEGKRLPYVFLAQVLGGSLVRVHSLDEARAKLREKESQDQPFDWVYVDDNLRNAQSVLFGQATSNTGPKKRKRQGAGLEESDRPPKKIRTLNDELVIQSLILGRLIEEGEMED